MTCLTLTFKWLWVQDIHFGVPSIPVGGITESFKAVYEAGKRRGIKKLVIGGDITDKALDLTNDYGPEFITFAIWLIKDAEENGIEIIIIEGTPSHDWKQARIFEKLKESLNSDVKLIYISTLSILYLEDFGNVLVVPDQWRASTSTTLMEVKTLLREKNLEQVDWAFLHGSFDYQVAEFLRKRLDLHDSDEYNQIVKKGIFVGHEHTRSSYQKIQCAGSIERTKHGQEEEKGGLFVEELPTGKIHIEFIRNNKAKVFKDILTDDLNPDAIFRKIDELKIDLNRFANIRLVATKDIEMVNEFIKKNKLIYPEIKWSVKNLSVKNQDNLVELETIEFAKVNLDVGAIKDLLVSRLTKKYPDRLAGLKNVLDNTIERLNLKREEL